MGRLSTQLQTVRLDLSVYDTGRCVELELSTYKSDRRTGEWELVSTAVGEVGQPFIIDELVEHWSVLADHLLRSVGSQLALPF